MFELRHLEYLTVIAEKGTLSAAAEVLHVTQPALTRAIHQLEGELGLSLFDRTKNRAVLNDAGRLAVKCAKQVLESSTQMGRRMEEFRKSLTTLTVGTCAPGPTFSLIPKLTALYPEMTISSEINEMDHLTNGLYEGKYRLIALSRPLEAPDALCRPYVKERLMVSLPKSHPLASREQLHISELEGLTMLLSTGLGIWQALHEQKMRHVHFIIQSDRKALYELIAASDLPNFVTNLSRQYVSFVPEHRVAVPLVDPEATVQFYLCASRRDHELLESVLE